MTNERLKQLMEQVGMPNSISLYGALQQAENEGFQAGAASRDAEIQRLQMALADAEALELGTAEKCDQLRAHVNRLKEALGKHLTELMDIAVAKGANSVSMPDEYVATALLLSSTPEQSLAEYRNKVIEDCAKRAEAYTYMSQNFNALAEELRDMKEQS